MQPSPSRISIKSEWEPLKLVLATDGSTIVDQQEPFPFSEDRAAKHLETGPTNRVQAVDQHRRFLDVLDRYSVDIEIVEPIAGANYQVFVRDTIFGIHTSLFAANFRDTYRVPEQVTAATLSPRYRVKKLTGGHIEGGDVFVMDRNLVLVGCGETSSPATIKLLQHELTEARVVKVPHHGLHLDCCIAPMPNGKCLCSPARLTPSTRRLLMDLGFRLIAADADEALSFLACNLLWLDPETVVSTIHVPKTNVLLRRLGFRVEAVEYDQLIRMWGGVRCSVCPLFRSNFA